MHALLFLYREVLGVTLPWLDGITRAKIAKRLPAMLRTTAGDWQEARVAVAQWEAVQR